MVITTQEKERAFDDLHRIAEQLETISRDTSVMIDALEDIAAALIRAYPEQIRPAATIRPSAETSGAAPTRAAGEPPSSESSGAAPMSDDELLEMVSRAAARTRGV